MERCEDYRHHGTVVEYEFNSRTMSCPLCKAMDDMKELKEEHRNEMNMMIDANYDLESRIDCLEDKIALLK